MRHATDIIHKILWIDEENQSPMPSPNDHSQIWKFWIDLIYWFSNNIIFNIYVYIEFYIYKYIRLSKAYFRRLRGSWAKYARPPSSRNRWKHQGWRTSSTSLSTPRTSRKLAYTSWNWKRHSSGAPNAGLMRWHIQMSRPSRPLLERPAASALCLQQCGTGIGHMPCCGAELRQNAPAVWSEAVL